MQGVRGPRLVGRHISWATSPMIVFIEVALYGATGSLPGGAVQTVASSQSASPNPFAKKTLRQIQRIECARSLEPSSIRRSSFPTYAMPAGLPSSALALPAALLLMDVISNWMELHNASVSLQCSHDGAF